MRHRAEKRRKELQRMLKARAKRKISGACDISDQNDFDFLIRCITDFHGEVFGSKSCPARAAGEPSIRYAMESPEYLWFIAVDPLPDKFFFGRLPHIDNSMFFATLEEAPTFNSKEVRGLYVIQTRSFGHWVSKVEKLDVPDGVKRAHQKVVVAQLAAHEIRHEVQHFCRHERHGISELKGISPLVYEKWQNRTLSVFTNGLDQNRIDREEDAIVVEQLVQASCYEKVLAGSGVVDINIQKIAHLISA